MNILVEVYFGQVATSPMNPFLVQEMCNVSTGTKQFVILNLEI